LLANLLKNPPENIRLSDELRGSKDELLRVAQEFGLEGLVAKRPNSLYESGRRSGAWVKFKITKSQEFVIGGYTLPEGGRNPAVMKHCQWVKPALVAQIKFTEWTHDDQLRQPVFLGLRTDKEAKDVVRE